MAGTEDYDFYANVENSPFWQRRDEQAKKDDINEQLRHWEKKLAPAPKCPPSKPTVRCVIFLSV